MNTKTTIAKIAIASCLVGACLLVQASEPSEVLLPFKQQLQGALQAGMKQGVEEAIEACSLEAPEIAMSLSKDGVQLGRTSHRLRNPNNASPTWVAPILAEYLADESARTPVTVTLDDGRTGYVEPIGVMPICTTCHGQSIAENVSDRINELYPEDQATGFEVGDLRGVFWIAMP